MHKRIMRMGVVAALAMMGAGVAFAAETRGLPPTALKNTELDRLAGQPVDIAPWAYAWRAGLAVQEKPEAYFIPRRLDRMDKVYRTAFTTLPQQQLKSIYYDMPDLLKPLLPPPKGQLQAGLLWTGGLEDYQKWNCTGRRMLRRFLLRNRSKSGPTPRRSAGLGGPWTESSAVRRSQWIGARGFTKAILP